MPLRSPSTAPPRYDSSLERRPDPKHLFDRDPLLIPQLFGDARPPWYRRRRWQFVSVVVLVAISTVGTLVVLFGPRKGMERLGHAGVVVVHAYTRLVAGGPPHP